MPHGFLDLRACAWSAPRRGTHLQAAEQRAGGVGHRAHRGLERLGVVRGRGAEPADLTHVLQRRRAHVGFGHVPGIRLTQRPDAPAHATDRMTSSQTEDGRPVGTICTPSGSSETGMILKQASPSGIPMIVTHRAMPVSRWLTASHQPNSTIQITLPTSDPRPASRRTSIVRPNGHSTYAAIRSDAIPNGIVIIRKNSTKQAAAASTYAIDIQIPQSTSQITFSMVLMLSPPAALLPGTWPTR